MIDPTLPPANEPIDLYVLQSANRTTIRTITLKRESTFLITDVGGDMPASQQETGMFWHDTRFLRNLDLTLMGAPLMALSHSVTDEGDACLIDLCNPYLVIGGEAIPQGTVHVRRWIGLREQRMTQHLTIASYHPRLLHLRLEMRLYADFRDVFEVRGLTRSQHGEPLAPSLESASVALRYRGVDNVTRIAHIGLAPPADYVSERLVAWNLEITPGALPHLQIVADLREEASRIEPPPRPLEEEEVRPMTQIHTGHTFFDRLLTRGANDMVMLSAATETGAYPYAGIPWYSCPFGRDGLITSLEFLPWQPEIARGTLAFLARYQGTKEDFFTEEQPGRILHEFRRGEMANCREIPFIPYYGTIDATPLFIITLAEYMHWTDDRTFLAQLWPHAQAAAAWMVHYGDRDGDTFLEYSRNTEKGLFNQGWKDSFDAVSHANGDLAEAPIALCEVQGYAFAAYRAMAELATLMGAAQEAQRWLQAAQAIQENFVRAFWWEAEQCFALALDAQKHPCNVVTSNAGQCLWSGIVPPELAGPLVARLMREDMDAGWGIRTLSAQAARYNPMSYHNGSVWPHDTAMVGAGFARYGFHREAGTLLEGLMALSLHYERARLPELCCGFTRRQGFGPTHYPVACSPQAWAAGAPYMLLTAILGMEPDATLGQLTLRHPTLPDFLQEVEIVPLPLGQHRVGLRFARVSGRSTGSRGAAVTLIEGDDVDLHVLAR